MRKHVGDREGRNPVRGPGRGWGLGIFVLATRCLFLKSEKVSIHAGFEPVLYNKRIYPLFFQYKRLHSILGQIYTSIRYHI